MKENMTAKEAVEKWDRGESIWSVEMGGLGPGYEQAIQVLIVELLRDNLDKEFPADNDKEGWHAWGAAYDTWGDDTVHRIDESCGGFSGAQVGVAKNVALNILRKGYGKAMNDPRIRDRRIQISKFWPRAPEMAVGAST